MQSLKKRIQKSRGGDSAGSAVSERASDRSNDRRSPSRGASKPSSGPASRTTTRSDKDDSLVEAAVSRIASLILKSEPKGDSKEDVRSVTKVDEGLSESPEPTPELHVEPAAEDTSNPLPSPRRRRKIKRSGNSLSKLKYKASSLGRPRNSEESSNSGSHSASHSVTPSISTLASVALRPFPLIRSQSSLTTSPTKQRPSIEERPRRRTEGEASVMFEVSPSPNPGSENDMRMSRAGSRAPSIALSQHEEELLLPDPENKSVDEYLQQLRADGFGTRTCMKLSERYEPFYREAMHQCLRAFMFASEPIDMSLRKFLMFQRLPLETQQIERTLQAFSHVYHEQNPQLFASPDQVYFVVFSMVILHTDTFNKNVKHKMSKHDYMRSAYCEGLPVEVFDYLYDNITYTQFIHTDDEPAPNSDLHAPITPVGTNGGSSAGPGERSGAGFSSLGSSGGGTANSIGSIGMMGASSQPIRRTSFGWSKDPLDPYTLILEARLDMLRPSIASVLTNEDPYQLQPLRSPSELVALQHKFQSGPIIQLVSQRSRPDAYNSDMGEDVRELTAQDLIMMTSPGVVDIKVVKMGILLRRESSKKMLYSKNTWRPWGAILTESQLYLFKNVAWVKSLMDTHNDGTVTRTALEGFSASSVLTTKDMAAVQVVGHGHESSDDKISFLLTGRGGSHAWFAAPDEAELVDWMRSINCAATYSTHHVGAVATPMPSCPPTPEIGNMPPVPGTPDMPGASVTPKGSSNSSVRSQFYRSASDSSLTTASSLAQQTARKAAIKRQLQEVERKIGTVQRQIADHERECRHLLVLAPIQQKTREALVFAAGQYTSKFEWCWLEQARYLCYQNVLETDLGLTVGSRTPPPLQVSTDVLGSDKSDVTHLSSIPDRAASESPLFRDKKRFEVNGHRCSLVDVNPDLLADSSSVHTSGSEYQSA